MDMEIWQTKRTTVGTWIMMRNDPGVTYSFNIFPGNIFPGNIAIFRYAVSIRGFYS